MKKSDFFYDLPEELIAQHPLKERSSSRLLYMDKATGKIEHLHFYDVVKLLKKGDCLVLNDTKVLPARIYGIKIPSGAKVEFLLLKNIGDDVWECITGPGKRATKGTKFDFCPQMTADVIDVLENGNRLVKFSYDGIFMDILNEIGEMPLPHYITEKLQDKDRYQTVYAKESGSAAAPTAGFHFTPQLLDEIKNRGINIAFVTLHVGIGTFRPVKTENVEDHKMHSEFYHIPQTTADLINRTKQSGGRVIAVGTTCTRTLESAVNKDAFLKEVSQDTNIFIYPPYKFKCIDGLITNFHLPESTLIMLVSAFAGRENVLNAYKIAVEEKYRFFSFGDAMIII
jgi:S-adenosylmethionine:tRNA ribosyltransferase-isomerase